MHDPDFTLSSERLPILRDNVLHGQSKTGSSMKRGRTGGSPSRAKPVEALVFNCFSVSDDLGWENTTGHRTSSG